MEENENKPVEEVEAEETAEAVEAEPAQEQKEELSREEILAISRKENKNGDEREVQDVRKGQQFAFAVGILLIGIIMLVKVILNDTMPAELWIVYTAMIATWTLYYGVRTNKHKGLFLACGIICIVAALFWLAYWILQLCGVI